MATDNNAHYLAGNQGDDSISGGEGNDFLDGGLGDDALAGGEGLFSYFFAKGQGNDTIEENSSNYQENDRLIFGDGITVDDLYAVSTHTGGNVGIYHLTIGLKNADGTITILDYGSDSSISDRQHINEFVFSDGTVLSRQEFMAATLGTAGNDHFNGSGESDDYVFRGGKGTDTIGENSSNYQKNYRLFSGDGIEQADVFGFLSDMNADGIDDLVIGVEGIAGSITVLREYASSNADRYQLDEFVFADGTTLDHDAFISATFDQSQEDIFVF